VRKVASPLRYARARRDKHKSVNPFSAFAAALLRVRLPAEAAGGPVRSAFRDVSRNRYASSVLEKDRSFQKYAWWPRRYSRASMSRHP
jgi:hypothetical protein